MGRFANIVVGLALLAGTGLEFARPINHDVAWTLEASRLDHAGKALYTDILEINPPLIFWCSDIVNQIAQIAAIPPETAYRVIVLLLVLLSAVAVLRFSPTEHGPGSAAILLMVAVIGVGWDFGQREHLIALLIAPFLAMLGSDKERSVTLVAGTGAVAAVAICLKPQYVLAVAVPALLLLRGARLAMALGVLFICGAAYCAAIVMLRPEYFDAVALLGPLYIRWATQPLPHLMQQPAVFIPIMLLALVILDASTRSRSTTAWLVAALASACAVVLQAKGFHYHYFTAIAFSLLAAHSMRNALSGRASLLLGSLTILTLAVPLWNPAVHRWRNSQQSSIATLGEVAPGSTIVAITPMLPDVFPAVTLAHLDWRGTFPHVWWTAITNLPAEQLLRQDSLNTLLVHNILNERPYLVAIERPELSRRRHPGRVPVKEAVFSEPLLREELERHYLPPVLSGPFTLYRRREEAA